MLQPPDSDVIKIVGCMLLPTVRIPTSSFFGLAWDPAMFCVSDSAPKVACSIGLITRADFLLVRVGAAGRAVTIPIPKDVLEFFSIVFLASIRKPTSPIFVGLPRNFSPWCLGDGTPIASVFVFAVRRPPWATRFGVDGDTQRNHRKDAVFPCEFTSGKKQNKVLKVAYHQTFLNVKKQHLILPMPIDISGFL